jgi:hypothetical protein
MQNDDFGAFVVLRDAAAPSPPAFTIAATSAVRAEGDSGTTSFTFIVTRSGDTSQPATVDVVISGTGANPADFTDFHRDIVLARRLSFAPSETRWTLLIHASGDEQHEADETFAVRLSNPSAGVQLATATALGTILNDDGAPAQPSLVGTAQQPKVVITAINMADGQLYQTTTDQKGDYTLAVPAGTYVATAYYHSMAAPVVVANLAIGNGPSKVNFDLAQPTLAAADLVDRTATTKWLVNQLATGAPLANVWGIWAASATLWEVGTLDSPTA